MNINKKIENYVIHLKFRENNGSGVVVKPFEESDYCYVFTARHTFEVENKDGEAEFISPLLNNQDFEIITKKFSQFKIESVIELENKKIDLLILCIKNYSFPFWDEIKPLKIFSGDINNNINCVVAGFPAIHGHNELEFYTCKYVISNEKDSTLEVESIKPLSTHEKTELDTNRGISGGGLFIEGNNSQIYLIGIEFEYKALAKLKCIDLRELIDTINLEIVNKKLDKIGIGGYPILDNYNIGDITFDLSAIEKELLNDYIKNVKNKPIEFLKDKNEKVNIELEEAYQKVLINMKDIAHSYLYRGAVFNETYNQLSTNNFKRAIHLNNNLEVYLERAKYIRNKTNHKKIDDKNKQDNEFNIDILKAKIGEEKNNEALLILYSELLFYLQRYEEFYDEDIIKYMKLLLELYVEKLNFKEAERILENSDLNKNLNKEYIRSMLFKCYFHSKYLEQTKLSKKEFSDKLITLLGMFKFESQEYFYIKNKLKDLNIFDNYIFDLGEKFMKSEQKFDIYEKNILNLNETLIDFRKDTANENKNNRFIQFSIYIILGILALTNDEIMSWAKKIWIFLSNLNF
jgi:hypothetical protein